LTGNRGLLKILCLLVLEDSCHVASDLMGAPNRHRYGATGAQAHFYCKRVLHLSGWKKQQAGQIVKRIFCGNRLERHRLDASILV
jgi:hypothetical protein